MKWMLLLLLLIYLIQPASAWANSDFQYYKPIEINNTGMNLTNYSYNIIVDTQSLISAGKMNLNGSDIRFYDSDDTTLLWHWNETEFNQTNTSIWINCSSLINTSNTTLFKYFGNTSAASVSNISMTFLFGDDFESGNLNQFDQPLGGTITNITEEVYAGTYAVKTNQGVNNFYENLSFGDEIVIEANIKCPVPNTFFGTIIGNTFDSASRLIGLNIVGDYHIYDGSFHNSGVNFSGYQKVKMVVNSTTVMYYGSDSFLYKGTYATNPEKLVLYSFTGGTDWIYMDNVFVRKHAEIEPTYSFGDEESYLAPIIIAWSNNVTNNNSLSFIVANETTVLFNITADQTITNWYWTNATNVQGNSSYDSNATHYFNTEGVTTVRAYGVNTNGTTQTKTWTVTIPDTIPPTQVTGLQNDTYETDIINISWTANTEGDLWGYEIFRDNTSIGYTQNNYYNDSGMKWNYEYNYKIRANDTTNNWGFNSTVLSVTTKGTFFDDFESYPIGSFNNTGQSNWTTILQTWEIISNDTQKLTGSVAYNDFIELSNFNNRNFNTSVDITLNGSTTYPGIIIRWDGTYGTGYMVTIPVHLDQVRISAIAKQHTYKLLKSEPYTFTQYQEYNLKVKMDDCRLTVYVDNVEILNYTDNYRINTIMSEGGSIGFFDYDATAFFDNFSVEMLPENNEYLNYFDYTSANANSVTLKWSLDEYDNATIQRGTSSDNVTTEIYSGTATTCIDTGLSTDTNYYYNIIYDNSTDGHVIKAFTYDLPSARKYLALGNSISTDYGALLSNESFPYLLNKTIYANNDSNITHHISAIGGYTTNGVIFEQLDDILSEKPTFITFMAGWNDFNLIHNESDYRAKFQYIINESTKHGIDCFVLKMINTTTAGVQPHVEDTNVWIDSLGQEYVVDTYDAVDLIPFDDIIQGYNSSFYQDGIHPNTAGTINLNKSIYNYMISENYFISTSTLTTPANSWGMFNNWTTATTFSAIAANESNDICYTYYNVTSGLWESYYVGYSWNADYQLSKDTSVIGYFNAQTDITSNIITPSSTELYTGWNMLGIQSSSNQTISGIIANIGANCSDSWYFNSSTGGYSNTTTHSIQPNQGFLAYITQNMTWTRSTM